MPYHPGIIVAKSNQYLSADVSFFHKPHMNQRSVIVRVNTFFEDREKLADTLKKYAKYADERFAYWDEFAFTTGDQKDCDAILIFNTPGEQITAAADPGRVIAFMMEPGIRLNHPWMFKGLEQYSAVYSPLRESSNSVASHGFLGWHSDQNRDFFSSLQVPVKSRVISCICSALDNIPGHRIRNHFTSELRKAIPEISYFGKGINFLPDKLEGLLSYKYSIALENSSLEHYFTEKINDCFLSYTVPLYYGCSNIGKYFPERSFIPINILDPAKAIKQVREVMENDDWHSRIDAVREARQLVLDKYQPLAGAAEILRKLPSSGREHITIKPVLPGLFTKTRTFLGHVGRNILMSR